MEYLEEEMKQFFQNNVENISERLAEFEKGIGIISNLNLRNENDKCYGNIILLHNCKKKLLFKQVVEFDEKRIKWRGSYFVNDEIGFYFLDPYWVREYESDPIIEVPIKVFSEKENKIKTEFRELKFKQFQQSKLNEFYLREKVPHIYVAAYKNFYVMKRPGQYYKAINSTIRNYFITEEKLKKVISAINHEKNRIKKLWMEYIRKAVYDQQLPKHIENLMKNKKKGEVIQFKQD